MAEGYLKSIKDKGYEIISRGLSADGSPAATNSVNAMLEKGIDITGHVSRQMTYEDAEKADEAFTILMGDQVEPRRQFIEKNAQYATLDV